MHALTYDILTRGKRDILIFSESVETSNNTASPIWHTSKISPSNHTTSTRQARYDNIEEAQLAIRAYKGGKPKTEEKFQNWCKHSLGIDHLLIQELWAWFSKLEETTSNDVVPDIPNQFTTIDEAKLGLFYFRFISK